MDGEGLRRVNEALNLCAEVVESELVEREDGTQRYISVLSHLNDPTDPSPINEVLDRSGFMFHESYGVTRGQDPKLKYLGSSASLHAYEDTAA